MPKSSKSKSAKKRVKVKDLSAAEKKMPRKDLKKVKGGEGTHVLYQDVVIPTNLTTSKK
jgi:hypothetical protein